MDNLNDVDRLTSELEDIRVRLVRVVPVIEEVETVNRRFAELERTFRDWKSHVDAWPPLETRAQGAASACTEAVDTLDVRFDLLRSELQLTIHKRLDELQAELFSAVDNAKADFASRLNSHRAEIERSVAVLRTDSESGAALIHGRVDDCAHRIDAVDSASRAGVQACEKGASVLRRWVDSEFQGLRVEQRKFAQQIADLNQAITRTMLWAALLTAFGLAVWTSRFR